MSFRRHKALKVGLLLACNFIPATGCATAASPHTAVPPTVAQTTVPTAQTPLIALPHAHLVSLGDSITFGEHLPGSKLPTSNAVQGTPSKDAYPYLIARDEHWSVTDLGRPAYASGQLLQWIQSKERKAQIRKADVVTVDIGSNDLLHAAYGTLEQMFNSPGSVTSTGQNAMFTNALTGFQKNLPKIIEQIRHETTAPIILMTLYDPFPDNTTLHEVAEPLLAQANHIIVETAVAQHCYLSNTYRVMNHKQHQLTRPQDIHPSIEGQQAIAKAVEAVIANPANHEPRQYAVISQQVNVHDQPTVFSQTQTTLSVGDVAQVVDTSKHWLTISWGGNVGYISKRDFKTVDRPWPVLSQPAKKANQQVQLGWLSVGTQATPLLAVVWHKVAYSPLNSLVGAIGATSQTDAATASIHIASPLESGIAGWWNQHQQPKPNKFFWPPFDLGHSKLTKAAKYGMTFQPTTGQPLNLNLSTTAYSVEVDGEPIRLRAPVVQIGNDLYLPAQSFWRAVGGKMQ